MVAGGGGGERPSPRWASYLHELMISRICKERSLDCCFLPDVRKAASYAEQAEHFYYDVVRRGAPEPDEPRKLRRLDQLVERLSRRRTEAEEVLQAGSGGGGAFYLINFLVNGEDCHGGLILRTGVARLLEVHPTSWMFSCPGAGPTLWHADAKQLDESSWGKAVWMAEEVLREWDEEHAQGLPVCAWSLSQMHICSLCRVHMGARAWWRMGADACVPSMGR
jgi:hypothetical protein